MVAPVIEEITFRGTLTPSLKAGLRYATLNPDYAAPCTSLFFGTLHPPGNKLYINELGHRLEDMTHINAGSLWCGIAAHMTFNCMAYLPLFTLSLISKILEDIELRGKLFAKKENEQEPELPRIIR